MDLIDNLKNIKEDIKKYKKKENEYLLNNSKLIFNYFEKKKGVSDNTNKRKVLHSFFEKNNKNKNNNLNEEINNLDKYLKNMNESSFEY